MKQERKSPNDHAPSPFHVEKLGDTTFYEAEKGVDWMSMFPDAPGDRSGKLIDLPAAPVVPDRPLVDETLPPPLVWSGFDAPPGRLTQLWHAARGKQPSRAGVFTSIAALVSASLLVFWIGKPSDVQSSPTLPQTVRDDRLTMDALGPAVEKTPSPGPGLPASLPPAMVTPAPVAATPSPRVTPKAAGAALPRTSPSPAARTTPVPSTRVVPTTTTRPATPSPDPALAIAPVLSPVPALTPSPTPISAPPPVPPSPTPATPRPAVTPSPTPATPAPSPRPAATPATTPAPTPAASSAAIETAAVRAVLDSYRAAYESLRSEAVQGVWPGANARALARAFEQIASQSVDFYSCGIDINAANAEANCTGAVTFVPKVGSKSPQTESRRWTFFLRKVNDRWMLDRVVSR